MTIFPPPSPEFIAARHHGSSQTPKAIVMHATVSSDNPGTARNIAEWWASERSPATSAHYVVDPRRTFQCVRDHVVAYHCGYNTGSIGVELCDEQQGPASRWQDEDSTAIIRRGARLVAKLCLAYNIEPVRPTIAELKAKGPHGIYGHNDSRLAFGHTSHTDPRDFPWDQFLRLVRREIAEIRAAVEPPPPVATRLHVVHASLQFSDAPAKRASDLETLFARAQRRNVAWLTGTEASAADFAAQVAAVSESHGYRLAIFDRNDAFVAVRESLIKGGWKKSLTPVLEAGHEGGTNHGARGVTCAEFDSELGHISVLAAHYLRYGRPDARNPDYGVNLELNRKLARAIGDLGREKGSGDKLAFYGGDQNIPDNTSDTFLGQPWLSVQDELEKWQNTGHGPIDVVASYNKDGRTSAAYCRTLDDSELPLNIDHFPIEAGFDVQPL